jgi:AcrR family transcriptional regulator
MPRAGLTADRVTVAAAELADEVGWERLTLAAVAAGLGVRQPSLYKHVDSLEALRRRVAALAVTELREHLVDAATGRAGREALLSMADAYRSYAHRYPGRYAASVIAPAAGDDEHVRAGNAIVAVLVAVLRGYDLPDEDAIHVIRGLRAVMHGFVALEAAGAFALPLDLDESYHRLISSFETGLARSASQAAGGAR